MESCVEIIYCGLNNIDFLNEQTTSTNFTKK